MVSGSGNCVDVHSNGHSLAVALNSGSVRIYDIRCNKLLQHYILHDNATSVSWHPSSSFLLTSGKDKGIRVVDVLEGKPIYTVTGHETEVSCVRFDKTGDYFASGGADKCILVRIICFLMHKITKTVVHYRCGSPILKLSKTGLDCTISTLLSILSFLTSLLHMACNK